MKLTIDEDIATDLKQPLTYAPKTALGEKLLAIRKRIVADGAPLLSWEEAEKEVSARRGSAENSGL